MGSIIAWIIRLFFTNPIIIAGIAFAAYYKFTYAPQIIKYVFTNSWVPYAFIAALGFLYAVLVKHVYYPNSKKVDWKATILSSFTYMFTIILAIVFTFAVLYAWDYAFTEKLDNYLRYKKM